MFLALLDRIERWSSRAVSIVRQSVLVRRSAVVFVGVIGAKLVTLAALLVLARLYDAEAFGVLGLFQALTVTVAVVAGLTYPLAITLPRNDRQAAALFWLSSLVIGATALITVLAVAIVRFPLSQALSAPALTELLWWTPGLIVGLGAQETITYWLTRTRRFWALASLTAVVAIAVALAQIAAWGVGATSSGLVVGLALGTLVGVLPPLVILIAKDRPLLAMVPSLALLRKVATVHWRFPLLQSPAALLGAAASAAVPLGLGFLFGPIVVGLYWMAERVGSAVTNMAYQTLEPVLLGRASEVLTNNGGAGRALFQRTTLGLGLVASLPTILVVAIGPEIFAAGLGPAWLEAGEFARWLAVAWLARLVTIPAVQFATALELQRWTLFYTLSLLCARIIAVGTGWHTQEPSHVLMIHGGGTAICAFILIVAVARQTSKPEPTLTRPGA